ncbi:MAG: two-component system, NtrC family, sensor kinase [Variibacter sp.]|jgi:two-component system NtrC family sensor kinase|nr:two-component system, NtrC family, sensor kinase [Variibacter sp.]
MARAPAPALNLLRLAMGGALALPALLFAYSCWDNYRNVSDNVDDRLERTLDVLEEQASRAFKSIELALNASLELVSSLSEEDIRARELELYGRLAKLANSLPRTQSIWLFDKVGRPLLTTTTHPAPREIDNSQRDYFMAQKEEGAGTYIGAVVRAKVGGAAIFTLSRRRAGANNEFLGVAAAAVHIQEFTDFYRQIGRSSGSYASLLRSDGAFLARYPEPVQPDARLDQTSTIRQAIVQAPLHGRFVVNSQLDQLARRIAYRKLPDFPVYAMAGLENAAIWQEWWEIIRNQLIVGVPATALLLIALLYAYGRTRRFYEEAERRTVAEHALRHAQKMEAIGQLTGGVAHDFNNLLMVVEGNLARLRGEATGARAKRALDAIQAASERGKALTGRLLSFSRKQPMAVRTIDVAEQARSMHDMLRRALPSIIDVDVSTPNAVCAAEVDPGEFELSILNLAVNARDAMPNGGNLRLRVNIEERGDTGPHFVRVDVEDSGSGIPPENLEKVFEPFFTTKDVGKGTGLGLSQVYAFAQQSGGIAEVKSTVGKGTMISLFLPLSLDLPEGPNKQIELHPASAAPLRVLVVDDNAAVGEATAALFEELGCTVTVFNDPQLAVDAVRAGGDFNLVFSDIVMPGHMDGLSVAQSVRKLRPDVPIVLTTGYSDKVREASALGLRIVRKPFSIQDIKSVIATIVSRQSGATSSVRIARKD